ncbi:MAG: response regulator transcription factor [Verrucomicrobiia bacterium]
MTKADSQGVTQTILIADDEPELLAHHCQAAGFCTATASDGRTALAKARQMLPSMVVLDLMLPELDGEEVCRALKADAGTRQIPILVFSAKAEEQDRVRSFELGADDHVTKPCSPREIILRVKSILRRTNETLKPIEVIQQDDLRLDCARHMVFVQDRVVNLTITEFRLLRILMEQPGRVHSREALVSEAWGTDSNVNLRAVDTHMRRLRGKLRKCAPMLKTIRGVGYRFMSD